MTAAETIDALVLEFDKFPDWEERYAHIITLGKRLELYPEQFREDKYKVSGCQSQVWLYAGRKGEEANGRKDVLHFYADSDAMIVRGLIAILMRIYNDRTPEEILSVPHGFVQRLGLDQHLSPSRTNGLASMMKQIGLYALAFKMKGASV